MPILTGLAPDPRQPGYRLVEVDRGRFASLPAEALSGLPQPLVVGVELSAPVLARLQDLADIEAAVRAAMRSLATRGRARGDLRRRLIQNSIHRRLMRRSRSSTRAACSMTGASRSNTRPGMRRVVAGRRGWSRTC